MKKISFILFVFILFLIPFVKAHVVISEVWYDTNINDFQTEFIELYNPHSYDVNISGWQIIRENGQVDATLPGDAIIPANGYYLITDEDDVGGLWPSYWPQPDYGKLGSDVELDLTNTDYGFTLNMSNGTFVDAVGWGAAENGFYEGTSFDQLLVNDGDSIERKSGLNNYDDQGNSLDTNNNSFDFRVLSVPQPQNSTNGTEMDIIPIIYLTYPDNNTYFNTRNINFTFNFIDNSNSSNCSIYLDNILNQTNGTTLNNTATTFEILNINESSNIEWKINCIDNSLKENNSIRIFTIDLTYPDINNTLEQVTSTTAIISWNTSENTNSSIFYGTNLNLASNLTNEVLSNEHEFNLQSLASNTLYYYNITSCDQANNCNNTNYTFTTNVATETSTTTTSSGGGSTTGVNIFSIEIELENTLVVKEEDVIDFSLNGNKHEIKIANVKSDSVILIISSDPISIEVKVGETKEVDLDNDDKIDLKVTLLRIFRNGEVRIIFEEVKEELIEEVIEEVKEEEKKEKVYFHYTKPEKIDETNLITGKTITILNTEINFAGILITIAIVVIGLVLYFIFKSD